MNRSDIGVAEVPFRRTATSEYFAEVTLWYPASAPGMARSKEDLRRFREEMEKAAAIQDKTKFAVRPPFDDPIFPYDSLDQTGPLGRGFAVPGLPIHGPNGSDARRGVRDGGEVKIA